jgi:hypothetical protein
VKKPRTLKRGLDWPPTRCVQGRLSILSGDEDESSQNKSGAVPSAENPTGVRRRAGKAASKSSVFHPLAYRGIVAEWPIEWRERWGRRANALEVENGLSWRDAETQAFVEVWNQFRSQDPTLARSRSGFPERHASLERYFAGE